MRGVEILLVVSVVMQLVAMVIATLLVNRTKYSALWICCILGLIMLSVERVYQLKVFSGGEVSDMAFAWVGIIVSLSFSLSVVCAHMLVRHVDRMNMQQRILKNRLMTAVLRTEERSRATFSRELHDGLGPLLSTAKMSLSALQRTEMSSADIERLKNTSAIIDEAIRSLREISNNLSPHVLINFGLVRGVKNFVERVETMHDVEISFTATLRDERFDSNIEIILYRVVCELINNSLKHSSCTKIVLSLRLAGDTLHLDYRDNGCGFMLHEVEGRGMGLSNINSRISSLNGDVVMESTPGRGMSAAIVVSTEGRCVVLQQNNVQKKGLKNGRKKGKNRTR